MSDTNTKRPPRAERNLAKAIGHRCRGRTAILGPGLPALAEQMRADAARGVGDVSRYADVAALEGVEEGFDTVVVAGLLEPLDGASALEVLKQAFDTLVPRGRLIVCVPNDRDGQDCQGDVADGGQRFTRSSLKKLLKKLEQPKEFTDQPFGWLLMAVHREPALGRADAERCRVIAPLCRGRVLELGCGPGHLSAAIAARGLEVCGIDMNARKIERARRRYPGITFWQTDMMRLPIERTFDTVVLAEVLEHVADDVGARMLDKAWSFVAPRGRLVVSVPNEDHVRHRNHVREFTLDAFASMLRRFGEPQISTDQPLKWLLAHVDRRIDDNGQRETGS